MPCIIECPDCGLAQYRINSNDSGDKMMQSAIQRGEMYCYKCEKKNIKYRVIKFKRYKMIKKLFPNKSVIYTRLDYEDFIEHPDDEQQPYVVWEQPSLIN